MAEVWTKVTTTEEQPLPETQYEIKDTVVIRTVTKTEVNRKLENIDAQIVRLQEERVEVEADLAKVAELEAAKV